MNMGWYEYKITYMPTNDTFKGDTEHNLSKDDRRAEVMLLNLYRKHMNKNTRINSNSIDKDDNDYWQGIGIRYRGWVNRGDIKIRILTTRIAL